MDDEGATGETGTSADAGNGAGGDSGDSDDSGDGVTDPELLALFDGERLGTLMMQQLGDLVESWTQVLEAVAQNGVDPTPVMHTLAQTLRSTADMLDPPA